MRILITGQSNYISHNGQSVFVKNLAEGLAKNGHAVTLLLPSERKRSYCEIINGVTVHTISSINLRYIHPEIYFSPFPPPTVKKVLETFQPEIIHIHDHYPVSWFVYLASRKTKIPTIGTNHFMPENLAPHVKSFMFSKSLFNQVMWLWMMSLYNRLDYVTAPSQTAISILRKEGLKTKGSPISCGVDLEHFHPIANLNRTQIRQQFRLDENGKIFLFVGRVDGEKRLDVALHALKILNRSDIQLAIAGIGKDMENLKNLSNKLRLGNSVKFLGFVPDDQLPALLNSVDIFAMPSQAELLSIATLEAMGCEKPILAAKAGALPELVSAAENGYLFEAGNPESAAQSMALLADHPVQWAAMGKKSRQKAASHHMPNIIQAYEAVYHSILHNKPASNQRIHSETNMQVEDIR